MKTLRMISLIALSVILSTDIAQAQDAKKTIAVISIDSRGIELDNLAMGNLVRLELEKTRHFEVLDKYDVAHLLERNNIDARTCFGKNQLVEVGQLLNADKMLTGEVERFGDKVIYTLRLIDVRDNRIEKTSVLEYVLQLEDIQVMTRISVNDLLGLENDDVVVDMLINFDRPITNEKTTLRLNGPRIGMQFYTGIVAERMMAPKSVGGFNASAYASVFGYQHEVQYISAGDFQALFEFIGSINGIETGSPSPSLTVLMGSRYRGWELGVGPAFRMVKMARGYYDDNNNWNMSEEVPAGSDYELINNLDSRGKLRITTGLILAVGKTFRSGYLNLPVNIYYSPNPQLDSHVFGLIVGFNIAKKPQQLPQ